MRLSELNPRFLKIHNFTDSGGVDRVEYQTTTLDACDGIQFLCPKCFAANKGPVGTHAVICWKPHVPQTIPPVPGRWDFEGTSIDSLSLKAGSSSVLLQSGCQAHFCIKSGAIEGA
jgi:hypothetical protein